MSSILDRLRRVEGKTFSPHDRTGGGVVSGVAEPSGRASAAASRWRLASSLGLAAGVLIVFVAVRGWKVWKGQTPRPREVRSTRAATSVPPPVAAEESAGPTGRLAGHEVRRTSINDTGYGTPQGGAAPAMASLPQEVDSTYPAVCEAGQQPPVSTSASAAAEFSQDNTTAALPTERSAAEVLSPEEDERTKSFLLRLKVSGVYRDANGYLALINGREFQKGDNIGQIEIVEIASERITFAYKRKQYHLPIAR